MACEVNPELFNDLAQAISAAAMPYLFLGIVIGAGGLFLAAYLYGIFKGE